MGDFRELSVFRKSFALAMEIFKISKAFPKEEVYSLTDQIRRSSRSVSTNIAEGYRKRQYPAHFVSKISDADMENSETLVWLEFALYCQYMNAEQFEELTGKCYEVGRMLNHIIQNPGLYGSKQCFCFYQLKTANSL